MALLLRMVDEAEVITALRQVLEEDIVPELRSIRASLDAAAETLTLTREEMAATSAKIAE